MRRTRENFLITEYLLFTAVTIAVFCLCVCAGSVIKPTNVISVNNNIFCL